MVTPSLAPEEYQYEDTGVLLNGDSALPFVDVISIDGLDSAPVRSSISVREGTDGGWIDAEFEDIRTVTIEGIIYASPTGLETYLDSLKENFAPKGIARPFYFGTDAGTRVVFGKSAGLRYPKQVGRRLGTVDMQVQLLCEDPRLYSPDVLTRVLPGTLTLDGNRNSTGTITIQGARTNPTITIGDSTFTFDLVIAAGETVVIDLNTRTVIKNGTTSVRSSMTITGGWPKLVVGNNVFTVGGSGAGTITVAARSAWR